MLKCVRVVVGSLVIFVSDFDVYLFCGGFLVEEVGMVDL